MNARKNNPGDTVNGWLILGVVTEYLNTRYLVRCPLCPNMVTKQRGHILHQKQCKACEIKNRGPRKKVDDMTREELRKLDERAHLLCKDLFDGATIFDVIKTGAVLTWRIFDQEGVCFAKGTGNSQEEAYQGLLNYLTEKAEC